MVYLQPEIDHLFTYHKPDDQAVVVHESLREAYGNLATLVNSVCSGVESANALDRLRESMMWANASVACNGLDCNAEHALRTVLEDQHVTCNTCARQFHKDTADATAIIKHQRCIDCHTNPT